MATSLLYLSPCLGPYFILVTAGSGGVCVCSYCSCCSCYGVTRAAIEIAGNTAIGTTYSAAIKMASGINRTANRISRGSYGDSYRGSCKDYY